MTTFFKNLTVIELAGVLAGPSAGTFFAELGAKVIKIENPKTGGDVTRTWRLPNESKESEFSAYYASVNYWKEVLMLDITKDEGYQKLLKLIKDADILITNFKCGSAEKLKLDFETLSRLNPELIYAQVDGFAPDSNRPAFDVVLQAESGFMFMNGTQESGPLKMPVALIDVLAAHQLKEAILLALINRTVNKEGAEIRVSLYKAAISALVNQAGNYLMTGHIPQAIGSLHPNIAPYGEIFKCLDDQLIVIAVGSDRQFKDLCAILEQAELADDPDYDTNPRRVINRERLYESLKLGFAGRSSKDLMLAFSKNVIPAGIIRSMEEVFEDPTARSMILEDAKPDGFHQRMVSNLAFDADFLNK